MPAGRPTKLTRALMAIVAAKIQGGMSIAQALADEGVSERTKERWLADGKEAFNSGRNSLVAQFWHRITLAQQRAIGLLEESAMRQATEVVEITEQRATYEVDEATGERKLLKAERIIRQRQPDGRLAFEMLARLESNRFGPVAARRDIEGEAQDLPAGLIIEIDGEEIQQLPSPANEDSDSPSD